MIRVCLAGGTGWAGSAVARAISTLEDMTLVSAVSRTHAGKTLGDVLGDANLSCPVYATAEEALAAHPCDVFFEFTKPDVAKQNVLSALTHGAHVVVGTSGLSDEDYADIASAAENARRGALAVGNFALTVVLLQKFSEIAAKFIPQWEIIDYASDAKKDSPSGTVRELANRLSKVRPSELTVPLEDTQGVKETRGARMTGSQVHSIRLPGYTISAEVIFGMPDQKLTIRHDSGSSAEPYVDGSLLAIRTVSSFVGLRRGLDSVLDLS
ncbi:MAG TPA: 4-hydroxy-tetrahydrodipicolinate reductase [Anaerolineales bacterium]|nr:4-hydroxy-tetrahydrodipicolinate reductase [Anaerolineales bacterium]HNQ94738.1 4-hydroxy-tetrahydrodipicolinate reductase [Anaerolineales bacterium]HNS61670.1 4-hydroxy-tetrahydrodipicolinate reductase [Anaerolineales bacterium]